LFGTGLELLHKWYCSVINRHSRHNRLFRGGWWNS